MTDPQARDPLAADPHGQVHDPQEVSEPKLPDLAAITLAEVRRSIRGSRAVRATEAAVSRARRGLARPPETSGSGPGERDPILLGTGISALVSDLGWEKRTAVAGVIGRWSELAGAELAAHVVPDSFDEETGRLSLTAESTTWATQVRILTPVLQARLDDEIGPGIVREIEVTGPTAPRRTYGPLHIPGRGPRDTYG